MPVVFVLRRRKPARVSHERRDPLGRFLRDDSGAALLEAALVLPLLILVLVGIMQFGLVFMNYIRLSEATGAGTRLFSVQRGLDTPWTDTIAEIKLAGPKPSGNLAIQLTVNGAACADDLSCNNLLRDAQGQPVRVTTSYSCAFQFMNALPQVCPLTLTMTGRVQ